MTSTWPCNYTDKRVTNSARKLINIFCTHGVHSYWVKHCAVKSLNNSSTYIHLSGRDIGCLLCIPSKCISTSSLMIPIKIKCHLQDVNHFILSSMCLLYKMSNQRPWCLTYQLVINHRNWQMSWVWWSYQRTPSGNQTYTSLQCQQILGSLPDSNATHVIG